MEDHFGTLNITATYTEVLQAKDDSDVVPLTQERINTFLFGENYDDKKAKNRSRGILSDEEIEAIIKKIKKNCAVTQSKNSKYFSHEEIVKILNKIVENSGKKDDE